MHAVLAHAVLDANDAKQLGLSSVVSLDAGDEQRASKLIALNGLDAREKWNNDCSFVDVLRPSGPNARICGDEPRCACNQSTIQIQFHFDIEMCVNDVFIKQLRNLFISYWLSGWCAIYATLAGNRWCSL